MGDLVPLQHQRLAAREAIGLPGRIEREGLPALRCSVVDISLEGASLWVPSAALPDLFALRTVGAVRHVCEVVWRKGEMVGARFLGHEQPLSPAINAEQSCTEFGRRRDKPRAL
jgi:hypothetical protein